MKVGHSFLNHSISRCVRYVIGIIDCSFDIFFGCFFGCSFALYFNNACDASILSV